MAAEMNNLKRSAGAQVDGGRGDKAGDNDGDNAGARGNLSSCMKWTRV